MSSEIKKSNFRASALASGLVSKEEIDAAVVSLRPAGGEEASAKTASTAEDEALADKLIEWGKINRWQADQLRAGRSRFTLGPYQILDSIAKGGMAEVYKAEHRIMRRVVAIKVLPRSKSTPEAIDNFCREIQTQAQLDHENLVRAFDAGHDGNVHFLVTEYVPGYDLRRHIKRSGKLNMRAAAAVICQASRGLAYAHQRGLIHRDVKPGNVLITGEGRVKLSDLGLAGFFSESDEGIRDAYDGKVVGTADYLSPEQVLSPDKLTPASDVYGLGCTLYYAVTGKVPFPGGTPREKVRAHCKLQPLDPRRLTPGLSDEFVDVIADMMHKDPAERIPTCDEVIRRLAPWAGEDWLAAAQAAGDLSFGGTTGPRARFLPSSGPGELEDTRPMPEISPDDSEPDESISQTSQGTHPMASAEEDTLWLRELKPRLLDSGFNPGVLIAIGAGVLTVLGVLGAMVLARLF